jgi:cobalamin synthase
LRHAGIFTLPYTSPAQSGGLPGIATDPTGEVGSLKRIAAGLPPINVLFPATMVIPPLSSLILARLLGKKLGGVTGDILGAICEINQVIFLFTAYIVKAIARCSKILDKENLQS